MFETLLSPYQELDIEDMKISLEFTEIGCICEKCHCNKLVHIVTSICESCLKVKHTSKIDIQLPE